MQEVEQSPREERIAGRLAHDEVGQRLGLGDILVDGFRDQPRDIVGADRPEVDLIDRDSRAAQFRQGERQQMRRSDLVVPIHAEQKEVMTGGIAESLLEQLQRGRVGPL